MLPYRIQYVKHFQKRGSLAITLNTYSKETFNVNFHLVNHCNIDFFPFLSTEDSNIHTCCCLLKMVVFRLKTCGATQNPKFDRTGLDRNRSRVREHFREYFQVGSGRVGEFYFGSVRVGVFFTGVQDIFSRDFGDKVTPKWKTCLSFPNWASRMVIIPW